MFSFVIFFLFVPACVFSLETPTVVWNSECRHMLGVVLRELEGATPGLQDVPTAEVQEVRYATVATLRSAVHFAVLLVCSRRLDPPPPTGT